MFVALINQSFYVLDSDQFVHVYLWYQLALRERSFTAAASLVCALAPCATREQLLKIAPCVKTEQFQRFSGLLPESKGQNLVLTLIYESM